MKISDPFETPAARWQEREPADPIELATKWRAIARRLKLTVWVPLIIASVVAGIIGGLLHIGGYWSVLGAVDGYYIVHQATVMIAFIAPAAAIYFPGYVTYRAILRARRSLFLRSTLARHAVDQDELTVLVRALE